MSLWKEYSETIYNLIMNNYSDNYKTSILETLKEEIN